jgi:hypothetical protein
MLAAFRQFYRRNFCPVAKAELLNSFDRNRDLCRAAIFVEIAPLAGIRIIHVWEEFRESGRLTIRKLDLKTKVEKRISERALTKAEVANVLWRLKKAGDSLGNYSGKARDGVYYSFCWGCPSEMSLLSISNPQMGSELHEDFVQIVKRLAEDG